MSGYFRRVKRCIHCGYFSDSDIIEDNSICSGCGLTNCWESFIAKIKFKYIGIWWKPWTWFNYKKYLVFPKKSEKR